MPASEMTVRLVAAIFLILANAFFVVSEFALTRLRQFTRDELGDDPDLDRAWQMTEQLEIYLTGCQLGITSTSIILGVVAEPAFTALLHPLYDLTGLSEDGGRLASIITGIVVLNLIHKIWGEQAPTYLGVERPREVARVVARPLDWWVKATYPLIIFGDRLAKLTLRAFGVEMRRSWVQEGARDEGDQATPQTPAQIREAIGEIMARGGLPAEHREEVMRAFETGTEDVTAIMVPRDEIVALRAGDSLERNLERARASRHTRYPLVGDDLDDFRGTIYLPVLVGELERLRSGKVKLESLAKPPLTVPADHTINAAIDALQDGEQELALVERDGRIVGLVTVLDAFEAIVGEFRR